MTNLNTLKNWFKSGLKPTQEQFWEWMDSFWHKEEKIPMAQIEGIDTALQNKADTEQLQHKVNSDASGLNEENVISWKTVLGVGELPTNIATIDEQDKTGNVHTKEQIRELLETSGKNLSNSDLIIASGEVRTLDTTGAKFLIKGLQNRKNESAFNLRVKANERGELAVSDEVDISVNIPSEMNLNHIYPSLNEVPKTNYTEKVSSVISSLKKYDFTTIEDWTIYTKGDLNKENNTYKDKHLYLQNVKSLAGWESPINNVNIRATSSTHLPANKNWILKIDFSASDRFITNNPHNIDSSIGLGRILGEDVVYYGITNNSTSGWNVCLIGQNQGSGRNGGTGSVLLIKIEDTITQVLMTNNKTFVYQMAANVELGDYEPKILLYPPYETRVDLKLSYSYKILN